MLSSLSDLLENWCISQQLEFLSADDLLHGYYQQLTIDQRDWLTNYIELWDKTQEFEVDNNTHKLQTFIPGFHD